MALVLQEACQSSESPENCGNAGARRMRFSAWGLPSGGKCRQTLAMERNTQLVGQSSSFLDAIERASRAASLDRPVLVIGERGTGKELVAERLHHLSSRWDGPLVVMNCAEIGRAHV